MDELDYLLAQVNEADLDLDPDLDLQTLNPTFSGLHDVPALTNCASLPELSVSSSVPEASSSLHVVPWSFQHLTRTVGGLGI